MRSPISVALIHPLNLLMLGLSVVAGLVSAWWLFPVGLLLWLIMVIAVMRHPYLRISHQMQRRAPLAQRFQRLFDRIERMQVSVFNSLSAAPAETRRVLARVEAEIGALTDQAHALCRRVTALENYRLVSRSEAELRADLEQTASKIESAQDPLVKREYEEASRSLQERLVQLQAVATQLDRVEAQLMSLANELEGVVTEVVRLQALGPQDAAPHVRALVAKLRSEADHMRAFEREAAEADRRAARLLQGTDARARGGHG